MAALWCQKVFLEPSLQEKLWELSLGQTSLAGRNQKAEEAAVLSEGGGRCDTVGTEDTRTSREA